MKEEEAGLAKASAASAFKFYSKATAYCNLARALQQNGDGSQRGVTIAAPQDWAVNGDDWSDN